MSSAQKELVHQLVTKGPVNFASASGRRIRAVFNGHYVIDTTDANHVWEHPYYPQYYFPYSGLKTSDHVKVENGEAIKENGTTVATSLIISVGSRSTDEAIHFADIEQCGKLRGLVKLPFASMDQVFEEEEPIYVHPKDPTKRIAILPSSRSVEVQVDGHVLAKTTHCMHLIEPMLPVRYYLPPNSVEPAILRPSQTRTRCPYKGEAEYYDIVIGGKTYKDLVWWYRYPTPESIQVTGLLCFYNEKVDVWLDGKKLDRPKSKFG